MSSLAQRPLRRRHRPLLGGVLALGLCFYMPGSAGAAVNDARSAPMEPSQNVGFAAVMSLPFAEPDARVAYGDSPQQVSERWYPAGDGPFPAVLLLHGGCWLNEYGVDHARAQASALRDAGFVVIAPEYRRVGDPGGGWTGTFVDVVDSFRSGAADPRVDAGRIALVGHSAGGHLALWLAAGQGPDLPGLGAGDARPALVVGLDAITDLDSYARGNSSCQTVTPRLMGGSPEQRPERYAEASPVRLPPPAMPVVLLQGRLDAIVSGDQARAYADAVTAAGGDVRIEWIDGAGHFDPIHPRTPAFARLLGVLGEALLPPPGTAQR